MNPAAPSRSKTNSFPGLILLPILLALALGARLAAAEPASPAPASSDYAAVETIFVKHCLDCHSAQDPEGKLVLESFESLMKGLGASLSRDNG